MCLGVPVADVPYLLTMTTAVSTHSCVGSVERDYCHLKSPLFRSSNAPSHVLETEKGKGGEGLDGR